MDGFTAEIDGETLEVSVGEGEAHICQSVEVGALVENQMEIVLDGPLLDAFSPALSSFLTEGHHKYLYRLKESELILGNKGQGDSIVGSD